MCSGDFVFFSMFLFVIFLTILKHSVDKRVHCSNDLMESKLWELYKRMEVHNQNILVVNDSVQPRKLRAIGSNVDKLFLMMDSIEYNFNELEQNLFKPSKTPPKTRDCTLNSSVVLNLDLKSFVTDGCIVTKPTDVIHSNLTHVVIHSCREWRMISKTCGTRLCTRMFQKEHIDVIITSSLPVNPQRRLVN